MPGTASAVIVQRLRLYRHLEHSCPFKPHQHSSVTCYLHPADYLSRSRDYATFSLVRTPQNPCFIMNVYTHDIPNT